jgi:hypothetical protein
MTIRKMLQSRERDILLVSALIATLVSLAFTGWGGLAYLLAGLIFAVLFLISALANVRHPPRESPLTGGAREPLMRGCPRNL